MRIEAVALLLASLSMTVSAQTTDRPALPATPLTRPPVIDGNILDDPAWQAVTPETTFTQNTPEDGMPVSQRTELRLAYTEDAVYVAFVCFDEEPERIIASDARRDAGLGDVDAVRFVFDTYRDEQNGFVFGTNVNAEEWDAQLSSNGENINWDGVWEVRTRTAGHGWSAEFRIPLKTLRYPTADVQSWGANFERRIARRHEVAFWSPLGRQFDINWLAGAGSVTGLEIEKQRNLQVVPYALGEVSDRGDEGSSTDTEFGLDVKYGITPSLTLDLTYNTDFAQVEADELQISLDRFNLFFPEKRPFFLENSGLFSVGRSHQVELFFSRRIGLSGDGGVIPIDYGARLSGDLAGTRVGLMYMQTDGLAGEASPAAFGVARVNRELPNRSSIGAILVDKSVSGRNILPDENDNRAMGADFRWGIGEYGLVRGYLAQTDTPGLDGDDRSWSLAGNYDSPDWSLGLGFVDVGENFNPEVGFVNRSGGYENLFVSALRRIRFGTESSLLELRPHFSWTVYEDQQGFKESGFLHIDNHTEWKSGYEVHTGINFVTKGLQEPFEIYEGIFVPAGTYRNREFQLVGKTDDSQWISLVAQAWVGGFYSGDRVATSVTAEVRLAEKFVGEIGWRRNDVELPEGDFTTDIGLLRLSWSFTPKIAVEALFQYNSVDDLLSTNLRFSWLRKANTGLYVVFNDIKGYDEFTGAQPDRSLIAKYTYLFAL